jgi:hypothetical protein
MSTPRPEDDSPAGHTGRVTASFGGPDVTQVFVHDVASVPNSEALASILPWTRTHCERALLLARPHDIVCVLRPVDGDFVRFLREMGIGPDPENIVVASPRDGAGTGGDLVGLLLSSPAAIGKIAERIASPREVMLNPFIASPREFRLAAAIEAAGGRKVNVLGGNVDVVHRVYYKHVVRAAAAERGIPLAPGEVVELAPEGEGRPLDPSPLQRAVERHIGLTGRVIVKGSCGTSGSSTLVVGDNPASTQNPLRTMARRGDNRTYLVDPMFDVIASPNIQVFVAPSLGTISCVSIGDQRLNAAMVHEGNLYPSEAERLPEMKAAAWKLAEWLRAGGFSGLAGFDFVEYSSPQTGEREYFLAELNPRVNGVTYPKSLMERFSDRAGPGAPGCVRAFLSANVRTGARSFAELRTRYGHLFFNPAAGKGLFPYNTGCLANGKFSVAFLGRSRTDVQAMHGQFEALLARE